MPTKQHDKDQPRLPAVTVREVLVALLGEGHSIHTAVEFNARGFLGCSCGIGVHVGDDIAFAFKLEPSALAEMLRRRIPSRGVAV